MLKQLDDKMIFTSKGIKNTRQRTLLFDILKEVNTPLSVEEIYAKVSCIDSSFNMSTVYRILEVFVSKGMVIKSNKVENKAAVFELSRDKHTHQLICLKCSKVFPIAVCPLKKFEESMKRTTDFEITGHKLEVFGYCSECKNDK
jgi:Fur family transcriptional regulator, ferric uptake regulator